jgi:hypothetical protein
MKLHAQYPPTSSGYIINSSLRLAVPERSMEKANFVVALGQIRIGSCLTNVET